MKAVILAGGLGTRLGEATLIKPKPMVAIGSQPILWHIMKTYSYWGINEFLICCGYNSYAIKDYFSNYFLHTSDVTFNFADDRKIEIHQKSLEPWKVTLVDTGMKTETGGRIARVRDYLDSESFCLTYGDGVADINFKKLLDLHYQEGKEATLTGVKRPECYGCIKIQGNAVKKFREKQKEDNPEDNNWVNGGFFVLEPSVLNYIDDDSTSWEYDVLPKIAANEQLSVYKHVGFWRGMDTPRDHSELEELWAKNQAPWKVW